MIHSRDKAGKNRMLNRFFLTFMAIHSECLHADRVAKQSDWKVNSNHSQTGTRTHTPIHMRIRIYIHTAGRVTCHTSPVSQAHPIQQVVFPGRSKCWPFHIPVPHADIPSPWTVMDGPHVGLAVPGRSAHTHLSVNA